MIVYRSTKKCTDVLSHHKHLVKELKKKKDLIFKTVYYAYQFIPSVDALR